MIELQLDNIGKTFQPVIRALDGISLTVAAGECVALVGPSGCGKTTLLRILAGLDSPTEGEVRIGGVRINHVPSHRRELAMLFQRPALIPNQSVRQNLRWAWTLGRPWSFMQRLFGGDRRREDELVRVAGMLGLSSDLDRPAGQLSGGQQQRVALGRCLLRKAKACLLDEPLGHLDAPLRTELRRLIRTLTREAGITMIHVTHDPEEAFSVGDRIAVMYQGQIVQVDTPGGVRRAPCNRYVAELIHHQTGGVNFLIGEVRRDEMDTFFESPLGRWPISVRIVDALRESLCEAENFHPGEGKIHIMIGVAVEDVRCTTAPVAGSDEVRITLPVQELESCDDAICVIAAEPRGRWIGRASLDERFERGQTVTMAFSMARAYWFDAATGRTLAVRTG